MEKIFFIDETRKLVNQLLGEKITMSRFNEILNEKATGLSAKEMLYKQQHHAGSEWDKSGIELIKQERQEQILKHGYTSKFIVEHPEFYDDGQMAKAASFISYEDFGCSEPEDFLPDNWPDLEYWERLCEKPYRERLIIAGALIAAEIDRLDSKPIEFG